jgi:hypothetical protein
MAPVFKISVALTLLAALAGSPALAVVPLPPTVPPGVTPQWTPVPGSPGVEWAPNLKVDLFRYDGRYYYWVAGGWLVGENPTGPWQRLQEAPPALRRLDPGLFKSIYKPAPEEPRPGAK